MRKSFLFNLLLAACASTTDPSLVYQRQNIPYPSLDNFPHCRSYGCKKVDKVSLTEQEKNTLKYMMQNISTAQQERMAITKIIGNIERIVGAKTGTSADVAGTYVKLGHMQHDCVDESTNTTTYLILLNQMGLLRFHKVSALTSRPPILSGRLGPHRTAVIIEKQTGTKYAVDSWFHDNGHAAEIVELSTWKRGWHPD